MILLDLTPWPPLHVWLNSEHFLKAHAVPLSWQVYPAAGLPASISWHDLFA